MTFSLLLGSQTSAQSPKNDPIHWAYASFFGIGRYSVGDTSEMLAVGFKPRHRFREAELLEDGKRRLGIALRVPFAIGAHELQSEDPTSNLRLSNVSTISAVPGVEIEIPLSQRWRIKPLAHLGWGKQTDGGSSAWIYAAGLKSELSFPATKVGLSLVNSLSFLGYSPRGENSSESGNSLPLLTGLEFSLPLKSKRLGGDPVNILWHVAHTKYLNELSFADAGASSPPTEISDLWELGVGFNRANRRLRLWKFSLDRVNLVFRADGGGDLTGIGITFSSLFDR